jgi:dethiobiotin synthetase
MRRIIFVTGTDTGVGKTVVTALLAAHAPNAIALKPFSSGERTDAKLLASVSTPSPSMVESINPWHFPEPLSPWTAARRHGITVTLSEALDFIRTFPSDLLLVEGAGGILTPLGERFTAADLITALKCDVILVAANRLGVLNQARMAVGSIPRNVKIALTELGLADPSVETNLEDLRDLVAPVPVIRIPFLKDFRPEAKYLGKAAEKLKTNLAELFVQKNPPDTEAEGTFSL